MNKLEFVKIGVYWQALTDFLSTDKDLFGTGTNKIGQRGTYCSGNTRPTSIPILIDRLLAAGWSITFKTEKQAIAKTATNPIANTSPIVTTSHTEFKNVLKINGSFNGPNIAQYSDGVLTLTSKGQVVHIQIDAITSIRGQLYASRDTWSLKDKDNSTGAFGMAGGKQPPAAEIAVTQVSPGVWKASVITCDSSYLAPIIDGTPEHTMLPELIGTPIKRVHPNANIYLAKSDLDVTRILLAANHRPANFNWWPSPAELEYPVFVNPIKDNPGLIPFSAFQM